MIQIQYIIGIITTIMIHNPIIDDYSIIIPLYNPIIIYIYIILYKSSTKGGLSPALVLNIPFNRPGLGRQGGTPRRARGAAEAAPEEGPISRPQFGGRNGEWKMVISMVISMV